MYGILQKMAVRYFEEIVKTYYVTFAPDSIQDANRRYCLSDILDMAYCIAGQFELEHENETAYFNFDGVYHDKK